MTKTSSKAANRKSTDSSSPDIGIDYDPVHVSCDEYAILEYEDENDKSCFLVDWRGEFDDMFDDINSRFTDRKVEPAQASPGFLAAVQCDTKKACFRSTDRVEVLKAIDRVLQGANEEMRILVESLRSDTVAVMVKPVAWWKAMDKHFKAEMKKTYIKLRDVKLK